MSIPATIRKIYRRAQVARYNVVTAIGSGLLAPLSPRHAAVYRHNRNQYRTYVAGELSGPNKNFRPRNRSADAEIRRGEKLVTARVRDQIQNNPLICGGIEVICYNVVRNGIMPEFTLRNNEGEQLTEANASLQRLFDRWQRHADATGHGWLCDLQKLIIRHLWSDGQILIHRVYDDSLPGVVPLRLELLECDHFDQSVDGPLKNGNVARRGIELDRATGRPVAYHILIDHPGDYHAASMDSRRIPARDIIHVYDRRRASQFSGISWLAAVVMEAYRMDEYRIYEQDGARAAAAFVAFVHSAYPSAPGPQLPAGGQTAPVAGTATAAEERPTEITRNQITYLPGGQQVTIADHNRPGNNYEPFVKDSKRNQASGMTMSYEALSRDFTDASYASARSGSLEERLSYQSQQGLLNRQAGSTIVGWFIEAAWLAAMTPDIPGYAADPQKYHEMHEHQEPGWTWVDPKNDALAAKVLVDEYFDTRTGISAQRGRNFRRNVEKQIEELELILPAEKLRNEIARLRNDTEAMEK